MCWLCLHERTEELSLVNGSGKEQSWYTNTQMWFLNITLFGYLCDHEFKYPGICGQDSHHGFIQDFFCCWGGGGGGFENGEEE